jgi:hypothetical protein
MTREEADKIVQTVWSRPTTFLSGNPTRLVDCLVELGVLKLDAPQNTISYEVVKALAGQLVVVESSKGFAGGDVARLHPSAGHSVLDALVKAGFKVVRDK